MTPKRSRWIALACWLALGARISPCQSSIPETEPNDFRSLANAASFMTRQTVLTGVATPGDTDFFNVSFTNPDPLGIYRYDFTLSGPVIASISGLANSGACPVTCCTDVALQSTTPGDPTLAWYVIGSGGNIYLQFANPSGVPAAYQGVITRTAEVPIGIGNFPQQTLTVDLTLHGAGLGEFYVMDGATNVIANDPSSTTFSPAAGQYLLAAGRTNLANAYCTATTGDLTDSANVFVATDNTPFTTNFDVQHAGGTKRPISTFHANSWHVAFFRFGVGQEVTVDLAKPGGPGTPTFLTNEGPANTAYLNVVTTAPGNFPNGWLAGIDIAIPDLVAQIQFGAPFVGNTGPTGTSALNVGVLPSPFQVYFTVRRLDLQAHDATPLTYDG